MFGSDLSYKLCSCLFNHIGVEQDTLRIWVQNNRSDLFVAFARVLKYFIYGHIGYYTGYKNETPYVECFCILLSAFLSHNSGTHIRPIRIENRSENYWIDNYNGNYGMRGVCYNTQWVINSPDPLMFISPTDSNEMEPPDCD